MGEKEEQSEEGNQEQFHAFALYTVPYVHQNWLFYTFLTA